MTSIQDNKIVIEHNFPIEKPAGCVIVNDMKMMCDVNVTIVTVE